MRILAVTFVERKLRIEGLWRRLKERVDLDLVRIHSKKATNLRPLFAYVAVEAYDRVLLDLPFRRLVRQTALLSRIPGLCLLEEDSYMNFLPGNRYEGQFARFYARLPEARLIVTGYATAERWRAARIDVHTVSKGYDESALGLGNATRDIEFGFVGRIKSRTYSERLHFLESVEEHLPLKMLRADSIEAYDALLNRIRFFVSADIGFGEYMAKNFEAMACGCVLVAKRQGGEEARLGLVDMENVVLYDDLTELLPKIERLRADPERAQIVAAGGVALAQSRHSLARKADELLDILCAPHVSAGRPFRRPLRLWPF